jgi:drug/metabolite transporter (DMT)-like permease
MKWQISAWVAMLAFSFSFLCFRRLCDGGVPAAVQLVYVSAVTMLGCLVVTWRQGGAFTLPGPQLAWAVGAGILCILGNVCQIHALGAAQNPGYALAIISTSAAVVCLLSALFLGTPLHLTRIAGIVLCGAGVFLVSR